MEKPFDRIAPYYNRWIGRFMSGRMDRMAEMLACSPEETVLDLGGGTGLFARKLVGRCKEIHLLDESLPMIEQAVCEKIRVRSGDATDTGYPDRSFDAVVLSDVIHHIREQNLLFREVARLLKPGGKLLVNEIDRGKPLGRLVGKLEGLVFPPVYHVDFHELCEFLDRHGFVLREQVQDAWSFIALWGKSGI
jgi:demethylmenaquinone methyltransferase/2-methoxy-6-polyprenyl-1,4-benzoquinol methylase